MTEQVLDAEILEGFIHQLLPEKPILTSRTAKLSNVFLAHYIHPACHLADHNTPFHVLEVIGNNWSSFHKRRFGDDVVSNQLHGGEIFFCPAGAGHEIVWDETMEFVLLAFHPKLFEEEFGCDSFNFFPLFNLFDSHIQSLVITIQKDLKMGCPNGSLYSDYQALALASHLLFKYLNSSTKYHIETSSDKLPKHILERVLEYFQSKVNIGEDINLQADIRFLEIARVAGMTQRELGELFQNSMKMKLHQYFDKLRVERARCLLLSNKYNVTEVATLCGFTSPDYFSRWFRKIVGVPPKTFQKDYWKSKKI